MMRAFSVLFKRARHLASRLNQWPLSLVAWAFSSLPAFAANTAEPDSSDVFKDMGKMVGDANTGIRGNVIIPIVTVSVLILAGAYFVGQSQWAKSFQKQIVVGGLLVALGGGFITYLTTTK